MDSRLIAIILARFSLQTTHVLNTLYTLNTRVVCGETSTKNKKWQDLLIARAHILCSSEDANSKLVHVVTVADEDRVGNNLLHIWKLRFGQKGKLLFKL